MGGTCSTHGIDVKRLYNSIRGCGHDLSASGKVQWRITVNTGTKHRVAYKTGNFLTSSSTISF
jgi:hypothetical protein